MSLRDILAPLLLAGVHTWNQVAPVPAGSFRILLLHDVLPSQMSVLASLIEGIARGPGFITPTEAAARLTGAAPVGSDRAPYLVSFDDGFASNREVADTVLARHGVSALFFICPGLVDALPADRPGLVARGVFDGRMPANAPSAQRPLMGWDDIEALAKAGHELGAHSMTHRRLAGLAQASLEDEVAGSCERLSQRLGGPSIWFAWPFGDIGSIDERSLALIGNYVKLCRSGIRGLNRTGQNRLSIFADHVDLTASAAWQKLAIAGAFDHRYRAARRRLARLAENAQAHAAP